MVMHRPRPRPDRPARRPGRVAARLGGGVAIALVALAACSREPTPGSSRVADERAVAQVEAAQKQKPPARMITPQPILFPDIEKHRLFAVGCAFAPGDSMGAVLLARDKDAYMKIAGQMVRLASDPGSAQLPLGAWSRYAGKDMAVTLTSGEPAGEGSGAGAVRRRGRLTVIDPFDQVIYDAEGLVQCG